MAANVIDAGVFGVSLPEAVRTPEPADRRLDEVLAAAQKGDEAAFSEVYRQVQPPLLRYLRVMVGGDAEDIASETWAQVCRDLHTFTGDGDGFRAWVVTIGRHRALDHHRATKRRPADAWPSDALTEIAEAAGARRDSGTEARALESLSTAAAIALIASLPPDQAEAVMLRAVMGLDAKTAGQVLGKRPGSVRTSAHRGIRTLNARLSAGGER